MTLQDGSLLLHVSCLKAFLLRTHWAHQKRLLMAAYDSNSAAGRRAGYLSADDLRAYVSDCVDAVVQPTTTAAAGSRSNRRRSSLFASIKSRSLFSRYLSSAILFFNDQQHSGRVPIERLFRSGTVDMLHYLRAAAAADVPLPEMDVATNLLSSDSFLRAFDEYVELDRDDDGWLSADDFLFHSGHCWTQLFVEQLFAYVGFVAPNADASSPRVTDFDGFLRLWLALQRPRHPASVHFLFRLLDCANEGRISKASLSLWYRSLAECAEQNGLDEESLPPFRVLHAEICDMFGMTGAEESAPTHLTLADLQANGLGATLIAMLTDLEGFRRYESREEDLARDSTMNLQ